MEEKQLLFEKYEIGKLLGKGTFAKVYYGKELSTGESVAIKVIKKDQVQKEGMMEQITREISVMRRVRHPNIVELKEVMATKSKIFFIMEYVKGGELFAKLVSKGKLNEESARKYFQQLISAVDFCHSRGVYHRDLKPENLLLDENEDLKVSDFGLSALPDEQLSRNDGLLHTQCGTPAYVAPEVLRRKGYDGAKADIWSCGVILYVLLAGFLPFQDENIMNMYKKIFKADYELPMWFSVDSRRLISKLLMADPERRITIQGIMRVPWFRKTFTIPRAFSIQDLQKLEKEQENDDEEGMSSKQGGIIRKSPSSPAFFNAFELISSMSSGFDLSSLFEIKGKASSMFTSRSSARDVMRKLEKMAKVMRYKVYRSKPFKLKMQCPEEGRKGRLLVTAEVFKVAPEVTVVEFLKSSGDTLEYNKFCEEEVRPALKDIVWTWQGTSSGNAEVDNKEDLEQ
ncbi:CBL-interacting serine/threonine-protein kinase 5-like [Nicotiana tabacum]|uniref:non-specific serine/threonine protein kinase n=5 Tax=Nicotiana TaxID=4085 RepID=A0A1S4BI36_TOBAC|nr:PREDICTED: CBL-interacting serine/threonine-protein kinase 5-like [Nicotiana sylvestris]XP_009786195.1 PREDICTED: CBL-interacting serine/threonine-protein kinase 5-like [Nicotiana sylvestris]XP_009786197.1 PREDICTED: CBL-interacting serine/threonine-protein kinase 5-like [Nicotiana sylvestris]XP_009786198.1 PREDICTED: CBL-interacting serine/threonine-protein kinase 5-like [Nicotiana sylvestris]XP_016488507.1 PREDICTED: CBL-interacting serine/threonine-protein kinase 5-like [Nicotiana tabacum